VSECNCDIRISKSEIILRSTALKHIQFILKQIKILVRSLEIRISKKVLKNHILYSCLFVQLDHLCRSILAIILDQMAEYDDLTFSIEVYLFILSLELSKY
jgi:hypothetical protein